MGATTTLPAPPHAPHDEWLDRRWRLTGLALVLLWLVVAAGVVVAGEKPSSYGGLLAAVYGALLTSR